MAKRVNDFTVFELENFQREYHKNQDNLMNPCLSCCEYDKYGADYHDDDFLSFLDEVD